MSRIKYLQLCKNLKTSLRQEKANNKKIENWTKKGNRKMFKPVKMFNLTPMRDLYFIHQFSKE